MIYELLSLHMSGLNIKTSNELEKLLGYMRFVNNKNNNTNIYTM